MIFHIDQVAQLRQSSLRMRAIQIFQAVLLVSSALAQIDDDKIVGGQDAIQGQFPYQVSLIRLQN